MSAAPPRVVVHATARAFRERAEPWLLRAEAEHALVLGIAARLCDGDHPAPFLATVETAGGVAGVALRTPPHKLLLTQMPAAAAPPLADAVAERFARLPAVLGPPEAAWAFGREWAGRHGLEARAGMRQRVFELRRLVPPSRPVPGQARPARVPDLDTVADWLAAFEAEAGVTTPSDARAWAERHVGAGDVWLWDDGGPVAMSAVIARSPTGARVGAVYTPAPLRGRGYATAVVAALSRRLLDGGCAFCSLYTDLSNPTSNGIYRRLGYTPVIDALDVEFVPPPLS